MTFTHGHVDGVESFPYGVGMSNAAPFGVPGWTLGDRLRKARRSAGVDREEMADVIGRTPRTVANYENGDTIAPKLVVREYALRCGVPYSWLMTGVAPRNVPPDTPASECQFVLVAA